MSMSKSLKRLFGIGIGGAAALTLAVKPRIRNKPEMEQLLKYDYANGGFTGEGKNCRKNSEEAIRAAVEHGYGIRFHVTSADTLRELLEAVDGAVPVILTVDPKEENLYRFCEEVFDVLDSYTGVFAVEAVKPAVLSFFRTQREEYIRGQIVDGALTSGYSLKAQASDFAIRNLLFNTKTEPDFLSCSLRDRKKISLQLCRLVYRVPIVSWVVRDLKEYETVRTEGGIVVFEGIEP
jgi:hypothetical protein